MTYSFKKKKQFTTIFGVLLASLSSLIWALDPLFLDQKEEVVEETPKHYINFTEVPAIEFIRFVSRISGENFIFDHRDLFFPVSLSTGKAVNSTNVVQALIHLLKAHGFAVFRDSDYYVIHKADKGGIDAEGKSPPPLEGLLAVNAEEGVFRPVDGDQYEFLSYPIQYHDGEDLESSLKKIAADLKRQPDAPQNLIRAIESLQWVKSTNSLLCSADRPTLDKLRQLIETIDVPLRQVFIEVLVIETDVKKSLDFGLQWAAGGQFDGRLGIGTGNFQPNQGGGHSFASTMQGINPSNPPSGLSQLPLVPGFDLGVIGDIILHKGRSYLSLGSLLSALQADGDSTIVLNQKIITQNNKNSTIFVGDNIPFTGSVVQTVGQSQQTLANIEYRDVGVSLSITPRLGVGDVITLDLNEEITESLDHDLINSNTAVNGIRTTKTNMVTHVHVPDKNFLVLSGMIRNTKANQKVGLPCLGGIPWLGAAFSKTRKLDEKRNVIIFVRPQIIQSMEDFRRLTQGQEQVFRQQADEADFQKAMEILPPLTEK